MLLASMSLAQATPQREIPYAAFLDRLRGGWAGQMVGVSYAAPYEFQALGKTIEEPLRPWSPDRLSNAISQDDLYVEMTFLETLTTHGLEPSWEALGADFRDSKYDLWHANKAARDNLRAGLMPPESGSREHNAHADDIDFQIEADLFGLIAPGLPAEAARLGERFGRIMNDGEGVHGGQFVAALYAQAYLEPDASPRSIRRCIDAGLAVIPSDGGYSRLVHDVLDAHANHPDDWRGAWRMLQEKWSDTDTCPEGQGTPFNIDAKLNGGYVVLGLLYGEGDFARTLEIATRCGQDADCNAATAAGVLGAILGFERIPPIYTQGLAELRGKRFSYTDYDFDALIAACERVAAEVLARAGGRIEGEGRQRVLLLPP